MKKAVFLDRDGTINVEKNYIYRIEDFEFLPGALKGMKLLSEADFLLIVITNQSGIARGYYSEDDYQILNSYMLKKCEEYGVKITDTLYCPHLSEAKVDQYRIECNCRKPKTGLFMKAVEEYGIDLSESYAIGDKMRDLAICEESNCNGFWITDDGTGRYSDKIEMVKSLFEAAQIILNTKKAGYEYKYE